jgi:hypothetical protein
MTNPTAATISVSSSADQRQAYLKTLLANVKAAVPDQLALPELRARADALVSEQTFPSTARKTGASPTCRRCWPSTLPPIPRPEWPSQT